MSENNIPVVCYLFTCFDNVSSLENFKSNYKRFDPGMDHELIICYKLLDKDKITQFSSILKSIKYKIFKDPNNSNDFDFGSYKRVAKEFPDRDILFLNSHSYPICNNWLKMLMKYKKKNTLIGSSASCESIIESIKIKKKYKIFSHLYKLYKFKKHFPKFPNPHLRTSSFLITGELLLDYLDKKIIKNKFDTWIIESGKDSLTNYFKNKKYDVFVINSEGKKFSENDWKNSNTYNYMNQINLIISDKHTRKYFNSTIEEKKQSQIKSWGI